MYAWLTEVIEGKLLALSDFTKDVNKLTVVSEIITSF